MVKLQDYKSVPFHLTEEDIRANIETEEVETLEQKAKHLDTKKPDILAILASTSFQDQISRKLNDLLFEEIIATYDCSCQQCDQKACSHKSAKNCTVNKGDKTKIKRAKAGFQHKWKNFVQNLQPNQPDQNFETIKGFAIEGVKEGMYIKMQNEIQGIFSNMVGRNSENNLAGVFEVLLRNRRGILFNGFKMKENLKLFFDAFNIKLPQVRSKGSYKERKEVEHDILHMAPSKDKVQVSFVQAKSKLNLPWTKENIPKLIETASIQLVSDIEAFTELATHFLTEEQFKMITFNANISMPGLTHLNERDLCSNCRKTFVYDEDKGKDGGAKYTFSQLKALFGQHSRQEAATPEADELFLLLSTIYAGGGSLVKLRYSTEKYEQENFYLEQVTRTMQETMRGDECLDKTMERTLHRVKTKVARKWISRNKNVKLSPTQNNLYQSGIGLKSGYCMIGGHGTGKTMMIQLEASRAARHHTDAKTDALIIMVVWEMKAKELLESYKRFEADIDCSRKVELRVMNKEELCQYTGVAYQGRDTTAIINDVNKKLSERNNIDTYLLIDEMEVENPGVPDVKDLVGKAPFYLGDVIFPWSNLDPLKVHLIASVTADNQDLARLVDIQDTDVQEMKQTLASQTAGKLPTAVLWRVFRCSNAIQETVEYLQLQCSKKDREFGFAVDPSLQLRGHDVKGDAVEWIPCPEKEHMICPNECQECFLVMINEALTEKISTLESEVGILPADITVVVSTSQMKRIPPDNLIKDFFNRKHPNVKVKLNFEMEGLEEPVVILIRNGGHLGSTISHGISRAVTKLVVISTDDNKLMEKAVKERKMVKVNSVKDSSNDLNHIIEALPNLFNDDPSVASAVKTILQPTSSSSMKKTNSADEVYQSIGEYYRVYVTKSKDIKQLREAMVGINDECMMCFFPKQVKAYILDKNTTKCTFSRELIKEVKARMELVREARRQYAAMQILEANHDKKIIKEAVMSYFKDAATFDEIEENLRETQSLRKDNQNFKKDLNILRKRNRELDQQVLKLKKSGNNHSNTDITGGKQQPCAGSPKRNSEEVEEYPTHKRLKTSDDLSHFSHQAEMDTEEILTDICSFQEFSKYVEVPIGNSDSSNYTATDENVSPESTIPSDTRITTSKPSGLQYEAENAIDPDFGPDARIENTYFPSNEQGALILDHEALPPVLVNAEISAQMKPHQKEGTLFMFNALFKEDKTFGEGCILAHCMGLGKTLQTIALIDSALTHQELNIKKILILCPASLVTNWEDEFHKWVPTGSYQVLSLKKQRSTNKIKSWNSKGGVLVMNYKRYKSLQSSGKLELEPDIVACDEGHELKNQKIKLYQMLNRIRTKKRIMLTGTPIQNNIREFYNIVNFSKPGILGDQATFNLKFAKPIENGLDKSSSPDLVQIMKERLGTCKPPQEVHEQKRHQDPGALSQIEERFCFVSFPG